MLWVLLAASILAPNGFSQQRGAPSIDYLSMDKIGVSGNVFSVAVDGEGVIYLAFPNINTVRTFDGATWRNIEISSPLCLATDSQGRVWVGRGQGVGYFVKNELNAIEYREFEFDALSSDLLEFYFAFSTSDGVRLCNGRTILEVNTQASQPKSKVYRTRDGEKFISFDGADLYTKSRDSKKAFKIQKDGVRQALGIDATRIDYLISLGENRQITVKDCFTVIDRLEMGRVEPFSERLVADDLDVSCILPLPGNRIGVVSNGNFACFDELGKTLYQIDGDTADRRVSRFGMLQDGRIWLVTADGLALLDERKAISNWPIVKCGRAPTYCFEKIDETLYFGTNSGLYGIEVSELDDTWPEKFKPLVNYTPAGVFGFDDRLFTVTMNGIVEIATGKKIIDGMFVEMYLPQWEGRECVFVINQEAQIVVYEWRNQTLHEVGRSELKRKGLFKKQLDANSFLFSSYDRHFSLVQFPDGFEGEIIQSELKFDTTLRGVVEIDGALHGWDENGVHRLKYENGELKAEETDWASSFNQSNSTESVNRIIDCEKFLAIYDYSQNSLSLHEFGRDKLNPEPDASWTFGEQFAMNHLKWDDSRKCFWVMNNGTLVRLDSRYSEASTKNRPVVSARVQPEAKLEQKDGIALKPQSGISFQFGLPYQLYLTNSPVLFQHQLVGHDGQWSDWSESSQKEYTNLPGGRFQFKVRAKDPLGTVSESSFPEFYVATVWYLQNWFKALLVFAMLGLVYLASVIRTRKLQLANLKMEQMVAQRTREIESKTKEVVEKSALLHAKELQSEAERLLSFDTLVAGVAHDFNNLLAVISANNELIAVDGDEQSKLRAQNSMEAIRGATDLCGEMTAFSDNSPALLAPVDVVGAIAELQTVLAESVPEEIRFQCELPGHGKICCADLNQLKRAMLNLVVNAGEAARQEVRVKLSTQSLNHDDLSTARFVGDLPAAGEFHCIEVVDDGTGLNNEVVNRIFDPFFTTKSFGRGLGLAIVLKIIGRHRGVMFVDTSPNGTAFRVCLPKSNAEIALPDKPHFEDRLPPLDILIVDDDPAVLNAMATLLRRQNRSVKTCSCPLAALEILCNAEQLDLMIADVAMPNMTGPELALSALEFRPDLPIILVSGFSEHRLKDDLLERPNVSFVSKPFSLNKLNAKIRSLTTTKSGAVTVE